MSPCPPLAQQLGESPRQLAARFALALFSPLIAIVQKDEVLLKAKYFSWKLSRVVHGNVSSISSTSHPRARNFSSRCVIRAASASFSRRSSKFLIITGSSPAIGNRARQAH